MAFSRLALVAVTLGLSPAAAAQVTFQLTSGNSTGLTQTMPSDSNNCPAAGPQASYVTGVVTNTGSTAVTDVQATLSGLDNGFSLTGAQSTVYTVGALAPGGKALVGWHIAFPCDTSKNNQPGPSTTPTLTVVSSAGTNAPLTLTLTSRKAISANAGGQVISTTLGAGAVIGQTLTADVLYDFGGNSVGDEFFVQPAGNTAFDANCLQLAGSEVTSSNVAAAPVGTQDQLFFLSNTSQSGNGYFIGVRYFYRYRCAGVTSTARPYATQTSGNTNVKYTGNFDGTAALVFNFPVATNPFTIAKTATPTSFASGSGPNIATYTVTVTNPSAFPSVIDQITDILPTGANFQSLTASSEVTAANSSSVPAANATGTLDFVGFAGSSYQLPTNGTLTLVYTSSLPTSSGSYTNTATATIGQETIGPAQVTV